MGRPQSKTLTIAEVELFNIIHRLGSATVLQVTDEMKKAGRDFAYTTNATTIRILVRKGHVVVADERRPQKFKAVTDVVAGRRELVREFVIRVFGGDRNAAIACINELSSQPKVKKK